jgi:DNA-binding NtrC family response regulator
MRIADLDLRELLDLDPKGGILRFAGQRVLLLDAVALGLLRKALIDRLGARAARALLTHFGFAHGWRTAESLRDAFPWDSDQEWRAAGGRLHTLQGQVIVEPAKRRVGDGPAPFAEALWRDSYEAEQHLLLVGQSDEPVCWTLCGFASGYLSRANGRAFYCIEERCRGKGDAACRVVGRSREEWGEAIEPHLPFFEKDCLRGQLGELAEALKRAEQQLRSRKRELARVTAFADEVVGMTARSEPMRRVLDLARRAAKVDSTVLVTGESGAGKERIARLIHDESARAGGPFVAVNCAAVSEGLLESELFGHVRGAFTGATQDRAGLFEAAGGGTLFLDEVGEVPHAMQVKLLRALQEREVRRVGENRSRAVDVRVVAATNRDLAVELAAGRFRKDLYYRLRVIELRVPPLRERRDDILPLARMLVDEAKRRTGRKLCGLSPKAADQLLRYEWPGNVREMQNAIERAVALSTGSQIDVDDLPEEVRSALPGAFAPSEKVRPLAEIEREYILSVLAANGGNRARTAAELRIGTATLYRKLKDYQRRRARSA